MTALFSAVIESAQILDTDPQFRKDLQAALTKLPPVAVGADDTILEWIDDYKEREPGHRHMSHLLGLHPFARITTDNPKLFDNHPPFQILGLRARGGFLVDIDWKDGKLTKATIHAPNGGKCRVTWKNTTKELNLQKAETAGIQVRL